MGQIFTNFSKNYTYDGQKSPALLRSFQKFKNHYAFMKTENQDLPHMNFYTRLDN